MDFKCSEGEMPSSNLFLAHRFGECSENLTVDEFWDHLTRCTICKRLFDETYRAYLCGETVVLPSFIESIPPNIKDPKNFLAAYMIAESLDNCELDMRQEIIILKLSKPEVQRALAELTRVNISFLRVVNILRNPESVDAETREAHIRKELKWVSEKYRHLQNLLGDSFSQLFGNELDDVLKDMEGLVEQLIVK